MKILGTRRFIPKDFELGSTSSKPNSSVDLASSFLLSISRPRTTCLNCLNEIPELRASNLNENKTILPYFI